MSFYTIKDAIRSGQRLKLSVAEGDYIVEPHVLGRNRSGKTLLRAFELRGPDRPSKAPGKATRWKLFDLDNVLHAVDQ